jgi:hypothetical protein
MCCYIRIVPKPKSQREQHSDGFSSLVGFMDGTRKDTVMDMSGRM